MPLSPGVRVVLIQIAGDDALKVLEVDLPLRDVLECGMIEFRGEYYSFYRLNGPEMYFMLSGKILKVE